MACFPGSVAGPAGQAIADFNPRHPHADRADQHFDVEVHPRQRQPRCNHRCATQIKATGKITATQFAIILTITGDVVTRFQMLEDSFDVSKAART